MASIRQLYVALNLRAENFNSQLREAQKESKEFNKLWAPTLGLIEDVAKGIVATGVAIVGTLAATTKISADYGDAIRDAAIRTGLTTQAISALKYQAEQTGTSLEAFTKGAKFLANNMQEAIQKSGDQRVAFEALGITVKDLQGAHGQLEPVLRKVLDGMSKIEEPTLKAKVAHDLFGKSAQELTEFLSGGAAAMDRNIRLTEIFGTQVMPDAADAADKFNDTLNNLKQASLGLTLSVGNELIPIATELVSWLTAAIVTTKDLAKGMVQLGSDVKFAAGIWAQALFPIVNVTKALDAFTDSGEGVSSFLKQITLGLGNAVIPGFYQLVTATKATKDEIDKLSEAQRAQRGTMDAAVDIYLKHSEAAKKAAEAAAKFRAEIDKIKNTVTGDSEATNKLITAIRELERAGVPAEAISAKLGARLKEVYENTRLLPGAIDPVILKYHNLAISETEALNALKKWMDEWEFGNRTVKDGIASLNAMQASLDSIEKSQAFHTQMQGIVDLGKAAKDGMVVLDTIAQADAIAAEASKQHAKEVADAHAKAAERYQQVWTQALGNVTSDLAKGLASVIFAGASFGKTMVDIAKRTAQSMFEAFLTGLLSPLTSALGKLGASLGSKLSGVFGGGGGGAGNLLGAAGGLGGLFGGGGTAATKTAIDGLSYSQAPAGAGGLFGLGSATIPVVGGAIAGLALLATKLIGQGRRAANDFVQNIQNPFASVLDRISKTGTVEDLNAAAEDFNLASSQFAAQGGKNAIVVQQAHDTIDPQIANLRVGLTALGRTGATVTNNFQITQQPDQDMGQLINEIIRYLQGNSGSASQFSDALPA